MKVTFKRGTCCSRKYRLITTQLLFTARKRSLGQGNIFTSVCQEFCPQGGVSASVHAGIPPPGPGRHPRDQAPPRPGTPRAEHAGRYSQRVGGTHPTGMHSCSFWFFFSSTPVRIDRVCLKSREVS